MMTFDTNPFFDDEGPISDWQANRMSNAERHYAQLERVRMVTEQMETQRIETERQDLIELSSRPEALYRVIQGENIEELQNKIDMMLSLGWKLNGGVQFLKDNTSAQAVSKPQTGSPTDNSNNHFTEVDFNL